MSDAPQPKTNKLATAALVLAIIPCTAVIGLVLGIVALVRASKSPGSQGKGVAIAAIVIPLVMGPITLGIAVPNFIRFGCRSKGAEAKVNLKSLQASEMRHRMEKGVFAADLATIGFSTSGSAVVRYEYRVLEASADKFVAEAIAKEPTLKDDRWTIDQDGEPVHVVDGCR
jgi:hypothetical protein